MELVIHHHGVRRLESGLSHAQPHPGTAQCLQGTGLLLAHTCERFPSLSFSPSARSVVLVGVQVCSEQFLKLQCASTLPEVLFIPELAVRPGWGGPMSYSMSAPRRQCSWAVGGSGAGMPPRMTHSQAGYPCEPAGHGDRSERWGALGWHQSPFHTTSHLPC